MSEEFLEREVLDRVAMGRRAFVKKLVLGAAFAIPAVTSFNMLTSESAFGSTFCSNQTSRSDDSTREQRRELRDCFRDGTENHNDG